MKECKGKIFRLNHPQAILQGGGFSARMELSGGNLTGKGLLYVRLNFTEGDLLKKHSKDQIIRSLGLTQHSESGGRVVCYAPWAYKVFYGRRSCVNFREGLFKRKF